MEAKNMCYREKALLKLKTRITRKKYLEKNILWDNHKLGKVGHVSEY